MAILKRFFFLFLPICMWAQPDTSSLQLNMDVLAGDDLSTVKPLDENTITSASRLPQDIRDISFTGYVISHEEIRRRGYVTLTDVLKDLPGVKVSQPGSALHGETFLMRGLFGNYYVKILVDDLPIQPSATSGMPIAAQLPVAQAERIEVIYGPAAAIYGADAMAGVINIVTKKVSGLQFLDVDMAARIPGHFKFDATLTGKFARNNKIWNFMAYGGLYQFDNLPITGGEYEGTYNPSEYLLDSLPIDYVNSPYYEGSETQPNFTLLPDKSEKFGLRFGNKTISFGFDFGRRSTHSAIGSNPLYKTYHDPNASYGEQIIRSFASYKGNWGKWYAQTNLQFLWYEVDARSNYQTVDNPYNIAGKFYTYGASSDLYFEQFLSRSFGSHWSLLLGGTWQFSGNLPSIDLYTAPFNPADYRAFSTTAPAEFTILDSLGLGPYNFTNIGGIVELDYKKENFSALAGLRADYREFYGLVLNPRIGLVLKTSEQSRIRFNASTAFRPPSSYLINSGAELFALNDSTVVGIPFPNNNLGAEQLLNAGIGWLWSISDNHSFDVNAFFHYNNNLISRTTSRAEGVATYYGFVNDESSTAALLGIQVVDRWQFNVGSVPFQTQLSLQYARGNESLPFNRGSLSRFRGQPDFTAKALIEFQPVPAFYIGVRAQLFSNWTTRSVILESLEDVLQADGFYFIDLDFRYSFSPGKEVYFQVKNVTNNHFYGIGASGGAGIFESRVIFEDLRLNPQMLRYMRLGVRITI